MRIYLDNCCFNRPFDDQIQMKVRLETEAKLFIQDQILKGKVTIQHDSTSFEQPEQAAWRQPHFDI